MQRAGPARPGERALHQLRDLGQLLVGLEHVENQSEYIGAGTAVARRRTAGLRVEEAPNGLGPVWGDWFVTDGRYATYETFTDVSGGVLGVPFFTPPQHLLDGFGASLIYESQVGGLTLEAIAAYREFDGSFPGAVDGSPLNGETVILALEGESLQLEARIAGSLGGSGEWMGGLFYFEQENLNAYRVDIGYLPFVFDFLGDEVADTRATAVFGHTSWQIGPSGNLSLGLRYSDERKDQTLGRLDPVTGGTTPHPSPAFADFAAQGGYLSNRFEGDRLDYRLSYDHQLTDRTVGYASVATGFRSGGVNPRPFSGAQVVPFDIEEVTAFELGLKSRGVGNRLSLDLAGFFNDYADIQLVVNSCPDLSPGPCAAPRNLADAEIYGAELEARYRSGRWAIDGDLSWIRLSFTDLAPAAVGPVDPELDAPESTPPWKLGLGIQREWRLPVGGRLTARVEGSYEDSKQGLAGSSTLPIESYSLVDARLAWHADGGAWEVALLGSNLTDEYYMLNVFDLRRVTGWASGQPGSPRRWAMSFLRRW